MRKVAQERIYEATATDPSSFWACWSAVSDVNLKLSTHIVTKPWYFAPQLTSTRAVATLAERRRILDLTEYDPALVY